MLPSCSCKGNVSVESYEEGKGERGGEGKSGKWVGKEEEIIGFVGDMNLLPLRKGAARGDKGHTIW